LHHVERLGPAIDHVDAVLNVFLHAAHEVAQLVDLAAQLLDAPVAVLDLVFQLVDALRGLAACHGA
jgi:hypothetical protein